MDIDSYLKDKLHFNEQQILDIKTGQDKIEGYTWHHHQETGRMQLVEEDIHDIRHTGGNKIWGNGD
ncbi:HNH endonuclease [Paenibacillus glacialis]|uniref:HNH endonuclease n=1 Tax=Paenibacillus glacialis TaxID=494026 RepID=UPI000A04F3CE